MPSPKAAPRAASLALLSSARAEASRINGAKSRGPRTAAGKARSAQNALKHGLRAQKYIVLPEEDAAEFEALEQAIIAELAPVGALQTALAQRVVAATWRLARAERLEADIFEIERVPGKGLGLALIRDCNGARAFGTLLRYRGGTLAELWRALRTLKALQGERAAAPPPDKPEARTNPDERAPVVAGAVAPHASNRTTAGAGIAFAPARRATAPAAARPREPEAGGNPGGTAAPVVAGAHRGGVEPPAAPGRFAAIVSTTEREA